MSSKSKSSLDLNNIIQEWRPRRRARKQGRVLSTIKSDYQLRSGRIKLNNLKMYQRVDDPRCRNALIARRNRQRKKQQFLTLQSEKCEMQSKNVQLRQENQLLKSLLKEQKEIQQSFANFYQEQKQPTETEPKSESQSQSQSDVASVSVSVKDLFENVFRSSSSQQENGRRDGHELAVVDNSDCGTTVQINVHLYPSFDPEVGGPLRIDWDDFQDQDQE